MGAHFMLPIEFITLVIFWFGPPLLPALAAMTWPFVTRGLFREKIYRAIGAYMLTIALSVTVGIVFLIWLPPSLNFLGVQDIFFAGHIWPVLPLSFLIVSIVSPLVEWWALRAVQPIPSIERDPLKRASVSIKS
jgi:hypothetical protein